MIIQNFLKIFCFFNDLLGCKIIHIWYSIVIMKLDTIKTEILIQSQFVIECDGFAYSRTKRICSFMNIPGAKCKFKFSCHDFIF